MLPIPQLHHTSAVTQDRFHPGQQGTLLKGQLENCTMPTVLVHALKSYVSLSHASVSLAGGNCSG